MVVITRSSSTNKTSNNLDNASSGCKHGNTDCGKLVNGKVKNGTFQLKPSEIIGAGMGVFPGTINDHMCYAGLECDVISLFLQNAS